MLFPFERELEAVSGFTNPFSDSFEDNELNFLSFRVPPNMFLNGYPLEARNAPKN